MMLPYFQVDAFTSRVFGGNPAGVCPLEQWLPDRVLQSIAAENNLSETAFFTRDQDFHLRWFTPLVEVDLCGHATLASAWVLFSELGYSRDSIQFQTQSGRLTATRRGDVVELDFPSRPATRCPAPRQLLEGLRGEPIEIFKARDYVAVFKSQPEVVALAPDMALLAQLDCLGIIATARGEQPEVDFVSRFFAPRAGIPEDPVTGSSHCSLVPFWAERLSKSQLFARQISRRGGELFCRHLKDRVAIGGRAVLYSKGEISAPQIPLAT